MSLSLVQSLIVFGLDSEMCRFVWDERRIFCQKDYDVCSNKVYPDKTPKLKKRIENTFKCCKHRRFLQHFASSSNVYSRIPVKAGLLSGVSVVHRNSNYDSSISYCNRSTRKIGLLCKSPILCVCA